MSTSVIIRSDRELREQRDRLIAESGMSYDELRQCAEDWSLNDRELSLWNTIQGIDFLLDDD